MVLAEGVWFTRATGPKQFAMRADVSRDGYVDFYDVEVLYRNWGVGCVNAVFPPNGPELPASFDGCIDFTLNGDETDVDCGGSCGACPTGSSCVGDGDCADDSCIEGVCGGPIVVDPCECNPSKCSDCMAAIARCEETEGCMAIVVCTLASSCRHPHEQCDGGSSCFDVTGFPQWTEAGQAANNVASCMGGC